MWPEHERDRAPVNDFPPPWASAWGDDRYGLWAELTVKGVTQRMRWIEPGSFMMGSDVHERRRIVSEDIRKYSDRWEAPLHLVILSQGYWLADTPCTQAMWKAVCGDNPSHFTETNGGGPDCPVEKVTWNRIDVDFLPKLGALLVDAVAALPTEAQWEYACRASSTSAFWWGDVMEPRHANVAESAMKKTLPVKAYERNPWGLYDMHGNVWEWCLDDRRPYTDQAQADPIGGTESTARILRGGAWNIVADRSRSAFRSAYHPGFDWWYHGFRFLLRSKPAQPGGR